MGIQRGKWTSGIQAEIYVVIHGTVSPVKIDPIVGERE